MIGRSVRHDRGYAMAALLVALSVMAIMLGMAMPAWRSWVQREREAELIFRGEQYAQAVTLFQRRTGGYPTSLAALRDGKYIRKLYQDPITNGEFQPVFLGQIGPLTPPAVGAGRASTTPGTGRGQAGLPAGRLAQPGLTGAPSAGPFAPQAGRAGQPGAGRAGQTATGAGPIIGVVSRSTDESMRLYNGRNKYNEWMFVSTAATQQAGAPAGGPAGTPGVGPGGRGRGGEQGVPGRGGRTGAPGLTPPGRSAPPGRGPGGFQPSPFGLPGRPAGPGGTNPPFPPTRGRL
jgi:type II secretory pathway pseudopilin PulG